MTDTLDEPTRAGFVALIGEPNAGKSTLLNRMVGAKVSIVTHKVQTTRALVRGIVLHAASQIVFVDTPGIFQPKRRLDRAMVTSAWGGAGDADVVCLLIDARKGLEEESEACFACLAFPLAHQARIRTTNGLERFHQELKRRTRVVRIFPNRAACLRLVTALCLEQSDEWVTGRRYLDLAELGGTDTPGTRPGRKEGAMQLVG